MLTTRSPEPGADSSGAEAAEGRSAADRREVAKLLLQERRIDQIDDLGVSLHVELAREEPAGRARTGFTAQADTMSGKHLS